MDVAERSEGTLAPLRRVELGRRATTSTERHVDAWDVVISAGDEPDKLYVVLPTGTDASPLSALCTLSRVALGASSVSIATTTDDGLRYVAADGIGADRVVGMLLPPGAGIAGFVAATGQSISVRDPVSDPRFARTAGERTGYIPNAIQCVAVLDADGDVAAVLSILDRGSVAPLDGGIGPSRAIELTVDLAAALLGMPDDDGIDLGGRLAALGPHDRERATDVVTAVLDAFES